MRADQGTYYAAQHSEWLQKHGDILQVLASHNLVTTTKSADAVAIRITAAGRARAVICSRLSLPSPVLAVSLDKAVSNLDRYELLSRLVASGWQIKFPTRCRRSKVLTVWGQSADCSAHASSETPSRAPPNCLES